MVSLTYLPDPEDPEWSWKEGIEMDWPAQSLYQLNEGRVLWDPYNHLRVNGMHPFIGGRVTNKSSIDKSRQIRFAT